MKVSKRARHIAKQLPDIDFDGVRADMLKADETIGFDVYDPKNYTHKQPIKEALKCQKKPQ